jgi:hypothetical protein
MFSIVLVKFTDLEVVMDGISNKLKLEDNCGVVVGKL